MLRQDFMEILGVMEGGLPVTIRLFDPPPLHEFLPPSLDELISEVERARARGAPPDKEKERMLARVRALMEANPMMGHRELGLE